MIEITRNGNSITLKTSSSQKRVGEVIMAFSDFMKQMGISDHSINRAIIVLRELLINAIKHGNRYSKSFPVTIWIDHLSENRIKISVKDLGHGFDYRSLDTALPENPKYMSTRGYRLVKAFTDSYEFNREGNEVTAYISTF